MFLQAKLMKRKSLPALFTPGATAQSAAAYDGKAIPQATRARKLSLVDYPSGKHNFLDSENTVLDLQLRLLESEAKAARLKWKPYRALGVASFTGARGARTYERTDAKGTFHTIWEKP